MFEKTFKYNTNTHYATGGVYKIRNLQIVMQDIQVASDIKNPFKAYKIVGKYKLPQDQDQTTFICAQITNCYIQAFYVL